MDYKARYLAFLKPFSHFEGLRVGVDCSNGMASLLARELFPGAEIINDTMDGNFPAHSPNPLNPEARRQIAELVRAKRLDCGVIFDGDADRCMFVDEKGEFVQPDYLIPFIFDGHVEGERGRVIHDVRTSRGTTDYLREQGYEPVMVPVGHAFAKPILREVGAVGGGELAGHYYFADFHGCDSGALAAIRILNSAAAAKRDGKSFSEMVAPVAKKYANSGERNYRIEDKDGAMARIRARVKNNWPCRGGEVENNMDGYRWDWAEGWVSVRKSNTEPYLRLLVECDTVERMNEWIREIEGVIGV